MKKNKILIGIIILCGVAAVSISGYSIYQSMKSKTPVAAEPEINQNVEDIISQNDSYTEEEKNNLTKEEKESQVSGENGSYINKQTPLGAESNEEYSEIQSNNLYNNLIKLAEDSKFEDIITQIKDLTGKYKFTAAYNYKISQVYSDAVILNELKTTANAGKSQMVKNLKNNEMMLIGTLSLTEKLRRDVIVSEDSLTPVFSGIINIKKDEILTDEEKENDLVFKEMWNEIDSAREYHKITFEVEDNELTAYLTIHENGAISLYKIIATNKETNFYQTIKYFKQLDNQMQIN